MMENLTIEKSETTPELSFDANSLTFILEGECRPENVLTYFSPILNWLNKFKNEVANASDAKGKNLNFHFQLEFYNSSSAKFLFNVFEKLKGLQEEGLIVKIHWYYDELDEDLLENGKEFEKILRIPFSYHPQISN